MSTKLKMRIIFEQEYEVNIDNYFDCDTVQECADHDHDELLDNTEELMEILRTIDPEIIVEPIDDPIWKEKE
ncbi:MAG: hypothetical protein GY718_04600 [Lentisphaerae bacterium]|nr:hypothetical protein [Lentisphaerota bacterium]